MSMPPTISPPSVPPTGSPAPPPAPPRGPGVRVPFLAPPKERNTTRITVTVVVAIVAVLACGAGSLVGVFSLLSWYSDEIYDASRTAATEFMDDVTAGDLQGAYDQACPQLRAQLPFEDFSQQWEGVAPQGTPYELGEVGVDESGATIVPVVLAASGSGEERQVRLYMQQEPAGPDGEEWHMSVCGWQ